MSYLDLYRSIQKNIIVFDTEANIAQPGVDNAKKVKPFAISATFSDAEGVRGKTFMFNPVAHTVEPIDISDNSVLSGFTKKMVNQGLEGEWNEFAEWYGMATSKSNNLNDPHEVLSSYLRTVIDKSKGPGQGKILAAHNIRFDLEDVIKPYVDEKTWEKFEGASNWREIRVLLKDRNRANSIINTKQMLEAAKLAQKEGKIGILDTQLMASAVLQQASGKLGLRVDTSVSGTKLEIYTRGVLGRAATEAHSSNVDVEAAESYAGFLAGILDKFENGKGGSLSRTELAHIHSMAEYNKVRAREVQLRRSYRNIFNAKGGKIDRQDAVVREIERIKSGKLTRLGEGVKEEVIDHIRKTVNAGALDEVAEMYSKFDHNEATQTALDSAERVYKEMAGGSKLKNVLKSVKGSRWAKIGLAGIAALSLVSMLIPEEGDYVKDTKDKFKPSYSGSYNEEYKTKRRQLEDDYRKQQIWNEELINYAENPDDSDYEFFRLAPPDLLNPKPQMRNQPVFPDGHALYRNRNMHHVPV